MTVSISRTADGDWNIWSVTERELEVWKLLARGCTGQEICKELFLSADTVKTHCRRLYAKLDATANEPVFKGSAERAVMMGLQAGVFTFTPMSEIDAFGRALTEREKQVLRLSIGGQSYRLVAQDLGLSTLTVKSHYARIAKAAGTGRRMNLLVRAWRSGIIGHPQEEPGERPNRARQLEGIIGQLTNSEVVRNG